MKTIYSILSLLLAATLSLLLPATANAAGNNFARGIVRDSITAAPLPYSSIILNPSKGSTVADAGGLFDINIPTGTKSITISCTGYSPLTIPIKKSSINLYDIYLQPETTELAEVVVKKRRYSKRNNPAVDFARRIRSARNLNAPHNNDYYTRKRYETISLGLNNMDTTGNSALLRRWPFLIEHVDSSEIDGAPVLDVSFKERVATEYWRKEGGLNRTVVHGTRTDGIDDIIGEENIRVILSDLMRDVDLYKNDIKVMNNTFVSPLSPIAPDFYRFYLVDSAATVAGSDEKHIALAFYPRNKASFGFSGHLYVPANDTTMFITQIDMQTSPSINLNFIKQLRIHQAFKRADDGSRLKDYDNLFMVLQLVPGTPQLYASRKIKYTDDTFERPIEADTVFSYLGNTFIERDAESRDTAFWHQQRSTILQEGENNTALLMTRLRQKKFFYWSEKVLSILFNGYIGTLPHGSKFDLGPVNTFASYNALEGLRLRVGGTTTANLSKHWFSRCYAAYGFRDHKWKYFGELEYSFNEKKSHAREFPVHSILVSHKYDIDRLGAHYMDTSADNFVLSLSRSDDAQFSYLRQSVLQYQLELPNHLSFKVGASYNTQQVSKYVPFRTAAGESFSQFSQMVFSAQVRFSPGEKIYQTKTTRINKFKDAPIYVLSHRYSPRGFMGSRYTINCTELSIYKHVDLSMMGNLEVTVNGGHLWEPAPFTELLTPNANLSYTIQAESFALMNPMEFLNTSYVAWYAQWQLRGALFNLIPGVKKLGLREFVNFKGVYGHLSKSSIPAPENNLLVFPENAAVSSLDKAPYMEISAGIGNILKLFRVDYVRRLNYLHVPYKIDKWGIRISATITF